MKTTIYVLLSFVLTILTAGCKSSGHSEGEDAHAHGHSHEEGESMEVELTQAQMDAVGIRLGSMETREMSDDFHATGVLEVDPKNEALVSSRLPGSIVRLCVTAGQKISAGQVVAYVDAPDLAILRQDYLLARQEAQAATVEYERQQALASQGAGIRRNLDSARSALTQAEIRLQGAERRIRDYGVAPEGGNSPLYPVKSEISGTVVFVEASIGSFADMQTPIARVVNNNAVFCSLQILEKDINSIKTGMRVEMSLTNDPSLTFRGSIADITPVIGEQNRAIPVKVVLDGDRSGLNLIPGMAVTANIISGGNAVEALPEAAVVSSEGKNYIFMLEDQHDEGGVKTYHFEKREVITGIISNGYVAVTPLEPLPEDASIVVAGAFYLNSMTSDHGEHNH